MSAKLDRAGLEGVMQPLLHAIDDALRAQFGERVGMALFIFPLNAVNTAVAYGSNAERGDMIAAIKEWLARAEAGLGSDPPGPRGEA